LTNKTLYKFLISALFVFFTTNTNAQLLSLAELDTTHIYTLEEALEQNPLKIYKLSLKKMKLTEIPLEVFKFKNLQFLDVQKNKLKTLPIRIGEFKYLQVINITANKIEVVTKELGELTHLKRFHAGSNDISSIPPEIKNLKELVFIDLWGNNIGSLPLEVQELKENLKEIDMRQIQMNKEEHQKIQNLLPDTKIKFSQACNCGF
jgi:Leucine-rich repeat (LRR) protein